MAKTDIKINKRCLNSAREAFNSMLSIYETIIINSNTNSLKILWSIMEPNYQGLDRNLSRISKLDYFIIQGEIINIVFLQIVDTILIRQKIEISN